MKKYLILISVVILLVVSVSAVIAVDSNQFGDGLNVTDDMSQALDDAKIHNKTVMIVFDQESCYYCDLFKEDVLSDEEVQKVLNESFIVVLVDINENPQMASEYKVFGTPTIDFVDSDLNELYRIEGYLPADEFLDSIREI